MIDYLRSALSVYSEKLWRLFLWTISEWCWVAIFLSTSICLALVLVRGDIQSYLASSDLLQLDFPNTILLVSFYLYINLHYCRVCRYLGALLCPPSLSGDVPTRAYCMIHCWFSCCNHKSSADTYDHQQVVLSKRIHIPFEDRGGIIGSEILPIEDDEIVELHSRYDIFELTSCQKWIPARFRTSTTQVEGEKLPTNPVPYHSCFKNASVKEGYLHDPGPRNQTSVACADTIISDIFKYDDLPQNINVEFITHVLFANSPLKEVMCLRDFAHSEFLPKPPWKNVLSDLMHSFLQGRQQIVRKKVSKNWLKGSNRLVWSTKN